MIELAITERVPETLGANMKVLAMFSFIVFSTGCNRRIGGSAFNVFAVRVVRFGGMHTRYAVGLKQLKRMRSIINNTVRFRRIWRHLFCTKIQEIDAP